MANKKGGTFTFLIIMVIVMLVYSIPTLRHGIGGAMDMILGPLVSGPNVPWIIVIMVLAAITGCYSSLLQKYTIDYDKMKAVQKRMKEFQKEFRETQLSGDEKKLKKLESKREKMMQDQMEMSQEQFKPMGYILIITVPIFLWLLYLMDPQFGYTVGPITLPFWGTIGLPDPTPIMFPAWILWYMICSIALSQVIRKALDIGGM